MESISDRQVKLPQDDPDHHTIGRFFTGRSYIRDHQEAVFYCDSWVENAGYWMINVDHPHERRNVSERAIGKTFHVLSESWSRERYVEAVKAFNKNIKPILATLDPYQGF